MNACFLVTPHTGGTYSVYRSLRTGLALHGVTVKWLGVGPQAQTAYDDPHWLDEREHGLVVAGDTADDRRQADLLISHLEASKFDVVFVNVLAGRVETNAMRYLSPRIRRVMIVHNITPGTYSAARTIRDHVNATVGVSPRIKEDLIQKLGFDPTRTVAIANAVNIDDFAMVKRPAANDSKLRLLSLGRIVDGDKGVFWLPKILDRVPSEVVSLTIAGDGADLRELRRRFAGTNHSVSFIGRAEHRQVPSIFRAHDVFLFPSRFEGLGLTLVEAMAAGCVPVASRIKGVTDFIVKDGHDGYLFDIGDVRHAAAKIRLLAANRSLLETMSISGRSDKSQRFNLQTMSHSYLQLLELVLRSPMNLQPPLPLSQWKYPAGLRAGLRTYLPRTVKNALRALRERI